MVATERREVFSLSQGLKETADVGRTAPPYLLPVDYDSDVEMEEIARTFDVRLMRLETFVREQVASQSA